MRRHGRTGARVLLAGGVLLAALATPRSATTAEPCCFTNEAYTGVCRVVPAENEDCAGVLGYLNDPNSSGKTYCGSTTIRGGWKQVGCGQ